MGEYKIDSKRYAYEAFPYDNIRVYSGTPAIFNSGRNRMIVMALAVSSTMANLAKEAPSDFAEFSYDAPCETYSDKCQIDYKLQVCVQSVPSSNLSAQNYNVLEASFENNCDSENTKTTLYPVFNMLADSLKDIFFKKVYVDVSKSLSLIDMNFNLGHKILLSVSKNLSSMSDDIVQFSLSVDGNVRVINETSLPELVAHIHKIQKQLA